MQPTAEPNSPCINVCRMHEALGVCRGCYRTLDEIVDWAILDDAEKHHVLAQVAARRAALGPLPIT